MPWGWAKKSAPEGPKASLVSQISLCLLLSLFALLCVLIAAVNANANERLLGESKVDGAFDYTRTSSMLLPAYEPFPGREFIMDGIKRKGVVSAVARAGGTGKAANLHEDDLLDHVLHVTLTSWTLAMRVRTRLPPSNIADRSGITRFAMGVRKSRTASSHYSLHREGIHEWCVRLEGLSQVI